MSARFQFSPRQRKKSTFRVNKQDVEIIQSSSPRAKLYIFFENFIERLVTISHDNDTHVVAVDGTCLSSKRRKKKTLPS